MSLAGQAGLEHVVPAVAHGPIEAGFDKDLTDLSPKFVDAETAVILRPCLNAGSLQKLRIDDFEKPAPVLFKRK